MLHLLACLPALSPTDTPLSPCLQLLDGGHQPSIQAGCRQHACLPAHSALCRCLQVLKQDTDKKIKAVCVVHNETTTGITSDVAKVRQAMDGVSHPALLLIDGVSSIGALDFQFDKWKVDVAMTGSQKALSLPTGLAVLAVSQKVGSAMGSGP